MPYILLEQREEIDDNLDALIDTLVEMVNNKPHQVEGNLNYVMTRLLLKLYGDAGNTRYAKINNAMGVLSCVGREYYRKVAVPYENKKELENGHISS